MVFKTMTDFPYVWIFSFRIKVWVYGGQNAQCTFSDHLNVV